jgi:hypothetical protein
MAAIVFNPAYPKAQVREKLKTALAALCEMLDAFVSNRMRQAAAQAEQVRTWRIPETQPMRSNPMRHAPIPSATASEQEGGRSGMSPAGEAATAAAQFLPLDPGIVSATIPAFFIGRNKEGFWVARNAGGRIGGIFLLESSAVSFAGKNSRPGGCVTIFPSERIELDLENNGNPLLPQILWLKRLAMRGRLGMAAFIGNMTEAVKRQLGNFHFR